MAWYRYCDRRPTVQAMVQAYLGIKTDKPESADIRGLLAQVAGAEGFALRNIPRG